MGRDISDEEVGIKSFHLRRERAVEQSIDKIRQNLGNNWQKLSFNDTQTLHWVLGEVWSFIARDSWNNTIFSMLEYNDIKKILEIAAQITSHKIMGGVGLDQVNRILQSKKLPNYQE